MAGINFILERLKEVGDRPMLGFQASTVSGGELAQKEQEYEKWLSEQGVCSGHAVCFVGDFSIETVALMLALINIGAISIPLTPATLKAVQDQLDEVEPDFVIDACSAEFGISARETTSQNEHYKTLRERQTPGLVLFTSGSTGKPKAVVHDYARLLKKFETRRPSLVTLNFLLFDHWGGLNTLLHSLANQSLIVLPDSRLPSDICSLIEKHKVELLPATPSFLNLLLISGAYNLHDVSSVKLITYGAEPMPASTLSALKDAFPNVSLRQTYGMIELGVLRAKSRSDESLWVKLGGEGYDLRVVDSILQIKADAAMLGYINAPSPLTDDGYFITGDMVEQDGEYLKILGRKSDLINVGGQKAYPAEIETVILEVDGVQDASVIGEKHALLGQIVCATVVPIPEFDLALLKRSIKKHCAAALQPYMVPVKIKFTDGALQSHRLKRQR